jgi:ElaB/YqjD/DUF883 family membrane-anchored ribosome-binding protein
LSDLPHGTFIWERRLKHSSYSSSLRQRLMQRLEEGKETLSEQQKVVGDASRQAARGAMDYAQQNPWSVVGVALGIGLIIGLILWSQEEY